MSEDTAITIEALQKKLDQQECTIKVIHRMVKNQRLKSEIFTAAVLHYQAEAMRMLLTTPENRSHWITEQTELRAAITDFGYCMMCGRVDICNCEPEDD